MVADFAKHLPGGKFVFSLWSVRKGVFQRRAAAASRLFAFSVSGFAQILVQITFLFEKAPNRGVSLKAIKSVIEKRRDQITIIFFIIIIIIFNGLTNEQIKKIINFSIYIYKYCQKNYKVRKKLQ